MIESLTSPKPMQLVYETQFSEKTDKKRIVSFNKRFMFIKVTSDLKLKGII